MRITAPPLLFGIAVNATVGLEASMRPYVTVDVPFPAQRVRRTR